MLFDIYDLINRRRDVRGQFTGAPLDDEALVRILGAAHAAPSVGLSQPWDFIVVRSPETRRRFRDHVLAERLAFADSLDAGRRSTFAPIKIEGILDATLGLVVTYDSRRGAPAVLGRHSIADAGLYSTCLAIQNLWLAATAEGLGVGWVSFYQEPFLQQLLSIPGPVRPVAWLCVGPITQLEAIPDLEAHGWARRRPLASAIHYEQYAPGPPIAAEGR
jgi:5,6-dimethylbenzimidazole synthase